MNIIRVLKEKRTKKVIALCVVILLAIGAYRYYDEFQYANRKYDNHEISGLFIYGFSMLMLFWSLFCKILKTNHEKWDACIKILGGMEMLYFAYTIGENPSFGLAKNGIVKAIYQSMERSKMFFSGSSMSAFIYDNISEGAGVAHGMAVVASCIFFLGLCGAIYKNFRFGDGIFRGFVGNYVVVIGGTYVISYALIWIHMIQIYKVGGILVFILLCFVYFNYDEEEDEEDDEKKDFLSLFEIKKQEYVVLALLCILILVSIICGKLKLFEEIINSSLLGDVMEMQTMQDFQDHDLGCASILFTMLVSMYFQFAINLFSMKESIVGKINEILATLLLTIWLLPIVQVGCWKFMRGEIDVPILLNRIDTGNKQMDVLIMILCMFAIIFFYFIVFGIGIVLYIIGDFYVVLCISVMNFIDVLFQNGSSVFGVIIFVVVMKVLLDLWIPFLKKAIIEVIRIDEM